MKAVLVVHNVEGLEEQGFLEDLEAYMPVDAEFDLDAYDDPHVLVLADMERTALVAALSRAVRVAATEAALTPSVQPQHDAYANSEAILRALLKRLRA